MSICRGCKTEFIPKRDGQKYHNRECFLKTTIRLLKCPECGDKFKKKFKGQVCCRPECAYKYRAKKNIKGRKVPCTFCGESFHKMPSRIRKYNFCNVEHRAAYAKSDKNKGMGINWHHTEQARKKISKANFKKDYNVIFTKETRRKLAEGARKKVWTDESKEKLRQANLGKNLSEEHKKKIKESSPKEKDNKAWKGEAASPQAKHAYAGLRMEKPRCADKGIGVFLCSKRLEKSNKDHEYSRNMEDWKWRCTRHHRMYEWQYGLIDPKGKAKRFIMPFGNTKKRAITLDGIIIEENAPYQRIATL